MNQDRNKFWRGSIIRKRASRESSPMVKERGHLLGVRDIHKCYNKNFKDPAVYRPEEVNSMNRLAMPD